MCDVQNRTSGKVQKTLNFAHNYKCLNRRLVCKWSWFKTEISTVMFQITASEFCFWQGGASHPVTLFVTTILIYSEHDFRCENDSYAYLDSAGILLFRLLRGCGRWTALSCRQRGSQLQLQPATSVNKVILSNWWWKGVVLTYSSSY